MSVRTYRSSPSLPRAAGWLLLLLFAGLIAGCASFEPPRPYTTEAEALSARGEPTRRWSNDDGTTTLEYSTQPNGRSCLMVQVDAVRGLLDRLEELDDVQAVHSNADLP